jgi:hypothetical protein
VIHTEQFGVRCSSYPSASVYLVGAWIKHSATLTRTLSLFTRDSCARRVGEYEDAHSLLFDVRRMFADSDATFCLERVR